MHKANSYFNQVGRKIAINSNLVRIMWERMSRYIASVIEKYMSKEYTNYD